MELSWGGDGVKLGGCFVALIDVCTNQNSHAERFNGAIVKEDGLILVKPLFPLRKSDSHQIVLIDELIDS